MLPEYDYAALEAEENEETEAESQLGDRARTALSTETEPQKEDEARSTGHDPFASNGFPNLRGRPTRAQQRAREIARLQKEQEEYEQGVKTAMKHAAFARCDAVEQLYEMLGVEPEAPIVRNGKNGPYRAVQDRDETKRATRLVQAVLALQELAAEASASAPAPAYDG